MRPSVEQLQDEYAFIALGSNLGNSRELVQGAIARLQTVSPKPILQSSLWESDPVDCPPGSPPFVNAVTALKPLPGETPESLLLKLQTMEREFGRRARQVQNEARLLDLDLITFCAETRDSSSLVLPHPRAHVRAFVLRPMAEICGEFVLPKQRQNVAALLEELGDLGVVRRIVFQ